MTPLTINTIAIICLNNNSSFKIYLAESRTRTCVKPVFKYTVLKLKPNSAKYDINGVITKNAIDIKRNVSFFLTKNNLYDTCAIAVNKIAQAR